MCGRATLAMVESSVYISVASIRAPVIGIRFLTSWADATCASAAGAFADRTRGRAGLAPVRRRGDVEADEVLEAPGVGLRQAALVTIELAARLDHVAGGARAQPRRGQGVVGELLAVGHRGGQGVQLLLVAAQGRHA